VLRLRLTRWNGQSLLKSILDDNSLSAQPSGEGLVLTHLLGSLPTWYIRCDSNYDGSSASSDDVFDPEDAYDDRSMPNDLFSNGKRGKSQDQESNDQEPVEVLHSSSGLLSSSVPSSVPQR
jgi:hypothetical protein